MMQKPGRRELGISRLQDLSGIKQTLELEG